MGRAPEGIGPRPVVAVARVQRLKGFDLLVEAFARAGLPAEVRLVIGGDGPDLASLREQAERLGLADRVVLPGRLDRPTVGALRRSASVGVVPSRFEAFGIAVLEVWRAGSPLIATTRGGPPEFVTDGEDGILVDPLDVDALADALRQILGDPVRASALGAAGTARVSSFTWGRTTDAYEELYRGVAGAQAETAETDIT